MDEITVAQLLVLPSLAQYSTGLLNVKNILNIRRPHDIPGYLRSSTPVGPSNVKNIILNRWSHDTWRDKKGLFYQGYLLFRWLKTAQISVSFLFELFDEESMKDAEKK